MNTTSVLTIKEVCEILKISRSTFYALTASGELKSFHIGKSVRVRAVDLQNYVDAMAAAAA